jgi:hypothetical protein
MRRDPAFTALGCMRGDKRDFVHFSAQHHVLTCQRSQAADP